MGAANIHTNVTFYCFKCGKSWEVFGVNTLNHECGKITFRRKIKIKVSTTLDRLKTIVMRILWAIGCMSNS